MNNKNKEYAMEEKPFLEKEGGIAKTMRLKGRIHLE